MYTPVSIINIGLSKIGAASISRIDNPRTSAEAFCSNNWTHWVRSELSMHRWVFATRTLELTQFEVDTTKEPLILAYSIPTDVVRVIRPEEAGWRQEGRVLLSDENTLCVKAIVNVETEDFDPLFVEALACRVAKESAEFITQSNTKKADATQMYEEAISYAKKFNAFVRGPENMVSDDNYPFLTERYTLL